MYELSDTQLVDLMASERPWNIARRVFGNYVARISIIIEESSDADTVAEITAMNKRIRRLEFAAVAEIGKALGVLVHDIGGGGGNVSPLRPVADPAGLRKWLGDPPPGSPETSPVEAPRDGEGPEVPPGREPSP